MVRILEERKIGKWSEESPLMMAVFTDVPKRKVFNKVTVAGNILVGLIILLSQEYKHVKKFDSTVKSSNL